MHLKVVEHEPWSGISCEVNHKKNSLSPLGYTPVLCVQTSPSQRKETFQLQFSHIGPGVGKGAREVRTAMMNAQDLLQNNAKVLAFGISTAECAGNILPKHKAWTDLRSSVSALPFR